MGSGLTGEVPGVELGDGVLEVLGVEYDVRRDLVVGVVSTT